MEVEFCNEYIEEYWKEQFLSNANVMSGIMYRAADFSWSNFASVHRCIAINFSWFPKLMKGYKTSLSEATGIYRWMLKFQRTKLIYMN